VTRTWFRRWGWTHVPVSPAGWLVVLLLVLFWIQVFLAVDRQSHSASDTLYGIFPFVVPSFLLFEWLASRTSDTA
jgi:peptidoglycan/LPS O-acetylase OafA/YrhL